MVIVYAPVMDAIVSILIVMDVLLEGGLIVE